jgi:hypothetical protein
MRHEAASGLSEFFTFLFGTRTPGLLIRRHHLLHLLVHCFTLLDQLVQNGYDSFKFLVGGCAIHFGDELVEFGILILCNGSA